MSLPFGIQVGLYCTFQKNSYSMIQQNRFDIRDVVHIQSMSEWAPLCIGNALYFFLFFPAIPVFFYHKYDRSILSIK
jgi:hypothetical protein